LEARSSWHVPLTPATKGLIGERELANGERWRDSLPTFCRALALSPGVIGPNDLSPDVRC